MKNHTTLKTSMAPRHDRWLAMARSVAFLLGILLSLYGAATNVLTTVAVFARPARVLPDADLWKAGQLANAQAQLGLPAHFYTYYALASGLLVSLVFLVSGWLILVRKSQDWFGLYLGIVLLGWSGSSGIFSSMPPLPAWIEQVGLYIAWFLWPGFFLLLYFFPSGQVTPRWARWFVAAVGFLIVQGWIGTALGVEFIGFAVAFPTIVIVLIVGVYAQIFRHRHAGPLERQQVKWVVLSLVLFVVVFVTDALLINFSRVFDPSITPLARALIYHMIGMASGYLAFISLPVSIVIAILRYRLWDIDVIIRRTLVWALLTLFLGLVYFGGVTLLQSIFTAASGQRSAIAIVISTLAIAALFNPLRRRVQEIVDLRFYRRKYNAEQALISFASLAREEVDLEEISARLLEVVQETVQPEHASLWLKPAADSRYQDQTRPRDTGRALT